MAINFININEINGGLSADAAGYVLRCEEIYNQRLSEAAEKIFLDAPKRPLVLLSGPSGSGKTTSAMRIGKRLQKKGMTVHIISMDDYFLPGETGRLPLDENGRIDLESPHRIDIPLFSEHLEKLFRCEPIDIPKFSFKTQSRSHGKTLCRKKDEIVIIEGIHALNPEVTGDTDDFTICVYVSVRTRIVSNSGAVLHPRTIRFMRRLCRDKLFRGREAADVFGMLPGVTRGEELYIMPYKHRADFDIDTFLSYEPSVYRAMILPELEKFCGTDFGNDYSALLEILQKLTSLHFDEVPSDSLVREFIGGSSFKY